MCGQKEMCGMYTLVRELTLSRLVKEQLPTLVASFIIAELFYKFHSFSLEAAAFLITWYVLDAARAWLIPSTPGNAVSEPDV
jgi:hypothetical protein